MKLETAETDIAAMLIQITKQHTEITKLKEKLTIAESLLEGQAWKHNITKKNTLIAIGGMGSYEVFLNMSVNKAMDRYAQISREESEEKGGYSDEEWEKHIRLYTDIKIIEFEDNFIAYDIDAPADQLEKPVDVALQGARDYVSWQEQLGDQEAEDIACLKESK